MQKFLLGGETSPNLGLINYSSVIIAYKLHIESQFRGHEHIVNFDKLHVTVYTSNNVPRCSAAYSSEFTGPHGRNFFWVGAGGKEFQCTPPPSLASVSHPD